MKIDRKISPPLSELDVPELLPYTREVLPNGTELITVHDPDQEVFKLDISFDAGLYYQPRPLVASTSINMLNEGTLRHNSAEIAEIFDYYGAYISFGSEMHKAEANLFSLNKFAGETLPLLAELVTESIVPPPELEIYLRNRLQQFKTDRQKTAWLARKEQLRLLFGVHHPYANEIEEKDFSDLSPETIRKFYEERIKSGKCTLFLSGNITPTVKKLVESSFGNLLRSQNPLPEPVYTIEPAAPGYYHIEKDDCVQTTIRVAKKGVQITQEDYADFLLLNTVLGGYFGSRLMSNIREEKGFTYGIHSFNTSFPLASYWSITTDVDNKYTEATLEEIQKEIKRIRTERIPSEELTLVKNYFHGDLLREIDGVFAQADSLKHKLLYGKDNCFYADVIRRIKECSAEKLRELADRYLNPEDFYIITVGKTRSH